LKLFASVIAKTVAYSIGFVNIHNGALLFLSALVLNVWLLPVLYVLAVPYGDASPFRKDRDMFVYLCVFLLDRKEREDVLHAFRVEWDSMTSVLASLRGTKKGHKYLLDEKAFL
jgi:hypothetical protein